MNKKYKASWVAALRSGKFKQGTVYLESVRGEFCCLGVLCKVSGVPRKDDNPSVSYGGLSCSLSVDLGAEFGLSNEVQSKLIHMNDSVRSPFSHIADYIEENL